MTLILACFDQPIEVRQSRQSHVARAPEAFTFQHNGASNTLVDTPGFNDTDINASDALKSIADWLDWECRYQPRTRLTGIIYLQNVMDPRMTGSSLHDLKVFCELCGQDPLENVLLVTSRLGMAAKAESEQAERRETQLRTEQTYRAAMLAGGARMARFEDTQASALDLIASLAELVEQRALEEAKEAQDHKLQLVLEEAQRDARNISLRSVVFHYCGERAIMARAYISRSR
ncbi:unnamed protein product [Zymoseptoria tritici ST99CH_3D1]|uniref:G domain-containing protein n=1 Tax=Zymoseptoria tritici ST99CH_1E4 TaxID=1276532 RepID=A0A2H1GXQ1_ZYMTR|nr:unnamed protein product [Zymoseptoria tritici ST99CH_1E4]SMR61320.1 unnamed protein product [Zymoseptoria tritici ST99CH_3D1]